MTAAAQVNNNDMYDWAVKNSQRNIWLQAQITESGQMLNAVQAYITVKGAKKGESNFKKQQRQARKGTYKQGCDLGTFVINNHVHKEILHTNEIDIDATVLRYGKNVKAKDLHKYLPKDSAEHKTSIFDGAAEQMRLYFERKESLQKKNQAADQIVQSAAGNSTIIVSCEGLQA